MRFPPEQVKVSCPKCGQPSTMPVFTIIDVDESPYMRSETLQGNINLFICPNCGAQAKLNAPYLYLDTAKGFAYAFIPPQLNLTEEGRQRFLGELTKAIMDELPPKERKGYLLSPKIFFSETTLQEAIWEKEGVSIEEQRKNRQLSQFLNQLLTVAQDEKALIDMIHEHNDAIDAEFVSFFDKMYRTQTTLAPDQQLHADEQENWKTVFDAIKMHSDFGRFIRWQEEALVFLREEPEPEAIFERLISIDQEDDEETRATYLEVMLPVLDYSFLMMLSQQIEKAEKAGQQEKATRLTAIRDQIVQKTEEEQKKAEVVLASSNQLLEVFLEAEKNGILEETVRRQPITAFSDVFHYVLQSHLKTAIDNDLSDLATRLNNIQESVDAFTRESLQPPSDPLLEIIGVLMTASYPEETLKILQELKEEELLTKGFISLLRLMADETGPLDDEKRQQLKSVYAQALTV